MKGLLADKNLNSEFFELYRKNFITVMEKHKNEFISSGHP